MLIVDTGLVIDECVGGLQRRGADADTVVLERVMDRVTHISRLWGDRSVVVAVEGPGDLDVWEARRHDAYARAGSTATRGTWARCVQGLPGTRFATMMREAFASQGWEQTEGGTCLEAIGRFIGSTHETGFSLYSSRRSVWALSVLFGLHNDRGIHLERIAVATHARTDATDVVLDLLVHGGLVQRFPGMQIDERTLRLAAVGCRLTSGQGDDVRVDRDALHGLMRRLVPPSEPPPDGRDGRDDALDKELMHIIGARTPTTTRLLQLLAILPRSEASHHPMHTDPSLGCVHMFPTTYLIEDGSPVIPALDVGRLVRGADSSSGGIHRSLEALHI